MARIPFYALFSMLSLSIYCGYSTSICYLCTVIKSRTIAFHTLGCKLNFAETSAIGKQLQDSGYQKVLMNESPDVFLLNTCSVTANADKECRTIVNRVLAVNPAAIVVVTGCFAQLKPDAIASIPGVDLVLGAGEKFNAPGYINDLFEKGPAKIKSCEISQVTDFKSSWSSGDRTRVFLKVQDGCDYNCSFCTIPLARGKSRSQSIQNVLMDAREIADSGAQETVLTGINLGDFGIPDPASGARSSTFLELIQALEQGVTTNRLRISSVEPNLLDDEIIIQLSKSQKFVPHFHIPLQSGSDNILRKMRRRYLTALYRNRIESIKALIPDSCIGADVIVGFPGESEKDFQETVEFIQSLDLSYLHVFTYSERDNTSAPQMADPVPVGVRKERNKILRILSAKLQRAFYTKHLGSTRNVLFEADNKDGMMHGYTDNYIRIAVPYTTELINKIAECTLRGINPDGDVTVHIHDLAFA